MMIIYLSHVLVSKFIILPKSYIYALPKVVFTIILCIFISLVLEKYFPKIYKLFSGNR